MTHYQELMLVDAGPDDVFRLVTGIESWQHLFPHVRSVRSGRPGRWLVTYFWRWVPFSTTASMRVDAARRMAEFRIGYRLCARVVVHCAVDDGANGTSALRLETKVERVAPLFSPVVSLAARELSQATLEMVRLLAESDRIARQNIKD